MLRKVVRSEPWLRVIDVVVERIQVTQIGYLHAGAIMSFLGSLTESAEQILEKEKSDHNFCRAEDSGGGGRDNDHNICRADDGGRG